MKTSILTRAFVVMLAWTTISGLASGQAFSSTQSLAFAAAARSSAPADVEVVSREAIEHMSAWVATLEDVRRDIREEDGFIRTDDELVIAFLFSPMEGESKLLRRYMVNMDVALATVPETFFTELDAQVDGLMAEVARIAPRVKPVSGDEADATVRGAIAARITEAAPEAKILRAVLSGDKWSVRRSGLGVPKTEARKGYVMYRVPGQELIVCQQVMIERPYFGADANDYSVKLGYLRLQTQP